MRFRGNDIFHECEVCNEYNTVQLLWQCPSVKEKSKFIDAVSNGYITWHAGPMNLQIEMANEPWLFEAGLDLSAQLDQRFGITREFRVLSQRDVPGSRHNVCFPVPN